MSGRFVGALVAGAACAAVAGVFLMQAHGHIRAQGASAEEAAYAESSATATPAPGAASSTQSGASAKVAILVYHIVRPSYPSDDSAVRRIALTPETFAAELAHLKEAGYHVIGFGDLEAYFATGASLPAKPVILSFDDGWRDQFDYAYPILKEYGDTATFFVFTNAIGRPGFLSWSDLGTLLASGMTIGDHSRSHPYLTRVSDPLRLRDEIVGSKALLESKLHATINEFAYPFGQYNPAILALVKEAGFKSARGDYWSGDLQSASSLYGLSAMNAPTTTAAFLKRFP